MRLVVAVFPLFALACQSAPAPVGLEPATADAIWSQVAFMTGCWRKTEGEQVSEEIWTPPHGDTMYGQNRLLRRGELVFFELLTIERRGDRLVYVARPKGRSPVEFTLGDARAGAVTFANPQHDSPKRIRYERAGEGAAEGGTGEALRAIVDDGEGSPPSNGVTWQRVR